MKVLCHRGLDFDLNTKESSLDSFRQVLSVCDGLEFDLQMSKDGHLFVWHDQEAERLTQGSLKGPVSDWSLTEIKAHAKAVRPVCHWQDLVELIRQSQGKLFALHLKGANQHTAFLDVLFPALQKISDLHGSMMVFDVRLEWVKEMKRRFPELPLALSVAHAYDIQRYNAITHKTLYSIQDCIAQRDIVDWAWLDEWDLKGPTGPKRLYTAETVELLKASNLRVAVVSPELHASSPGLFGGEAHEEGGSLELLKSCWKTLETLGVDALCTDHPKRVHTSVVSGSF